MSLPQPSPKLALKVNVDTYRGSREGIPRLLALFEKYQANATFFLNLGPDETAYGRAKHLPPRLTAGFWNKTGHLSLPTHYGWLSFLRGRVLSSPIIGKKCQAIFQGLRVAGFEVGVQGWSSARWQTDIATADNAWTEKEMAKAIERFTRIFGLAPEVHGAAGWKMNRHALRLTQQGGFHYASDCRGQHPFFPVWQGEPVHCLQLPTTLPTLDELMFTQHLDEERVAGYLLNQSQEIPAHGFGHVFTLHADLEGMKRLPQLEILLAGWKQQGYELVSLSQLAHGLDISQIPFHNVSMNEYPGYNAPILVQGEVFAA